VRNTTTQIAQSLTAVYPQIIQVRAAARGRGVSESSAISGNQAIGEYLQSSFRFSL
jgi:hypothetical protein